MTLWALTSNCFLPKHNTLGELRDSLLRSHQVTTGKSAELLRDCLVTTVNTWWRLGDLAPNCLYLLYYYRENIFDFCAQVKKKPKGKRAKQVTTARYAPS